MPGFQATDPRVVGGSGKPVEICCRGPPARFDSVSSHFGSNDLVQLVQGDPVTRVRGHQLQQVGNCLIRGSKLHDSRTEWRCSFIAANGHGRRKDASARVDGGRGRDGTCVACRRCVGSFEPSFSLLKVDGSGKASHLLEQFGGSPERIAS